MVAGHVTLALAVSGIVLAIASSQVWQPPRPAGSPLAGRSARAPSDKKAKRVLAMHRDGLSYRLIGRNIGLSKNTVMEIVRRGTTA
jgi:hypothetical protein